DVRLCEASPSAFSRARDAVPFSRRRGWFIHSRLPDGHRYLRWKDLFEFIISPNGRRISYRRLNHATDDSLAVYLLGQVLSFSLVARGAEPLHGTVVGVEGQAIALLGDCGRGKSTLGAAMLSRGCRLL